METFILMSTEAVSKLSNPIDINLISSYNPESQMYESYKQCKCIYGIDDLYNAVYTYYYLKKNNRRRISIVKINSSNQFNKLPSQFNIKDYSIVYNLYKNIESLNLTVIQNDTITECIEEIRSNKKQKPREEDTPLTQSIIKDTPSTQPTNTNILPTQQKTDAVSSGKQIKNIIIISGFLIGLILGFICGIYYTNLADRHSFIAALVAIALIVISIYLVIININQKNKE